jgi:serine/threonine protein phosphatase PrpC
VLRPGDTLMVCSDGLWHYFNNRELATVLSGLAPREAAELLVNKARLRAQGGGDNLSLAIVRLVEGD